jgi:hypothetical protein
VCRGGKVVRIEEWDDKDALTQHKVTILELNNYILTHLVILYVVVMKPDTILTYFMKLLDNSHGLTPYILRLSLCDSYM